MSVTYFAYGSNMAPGVMARLCPQHRYLGPARLDDHRLAFTRRSVKTGTGVADVVSAPGHTVWGALYEISDDELARVDKKEGYDWAYTRVMLPVRPANGPERPAVVYTVAAKQTPEIPPSPAYLAGVIAAARERGLPEDYITGLSAVITTTGSS
jgi:gamma-glutamylcyclotransferase